MGVVAADVLVARAAANGYERGAYREQDQLTGLGKHVKKTINNHEKTLRRYVVWYLNGMSQDYALRGLPPPTEEMACEECLRLGIEAPDLATVKDFIRFYAATSNPRLGDKPTCDSINTIAEWFFAGFSRVTVTETNEEERSEVYNDLTRILVTLWTKDDQIYIHERYRVQFTFIIRVYCWTGARLGAFFTGGLRYRDVTLVLQRVPATRRWRLIYKINQRWVKNNRDPENIVFGTAGREHDMFIYDDSAFLLSLAFANKALYGFDTFDDLCAQQIPAGKNELVLRFRQEVLHKPILRQCTKKDGVTEGPMNEATFTNIFKSTLRNAGYLCATSVHAIRRQIGKKVDELYTEVQRSQHLTQSDPRIFVQSYVANTSSVDGQGAFLGEPTDHRHIDYFQSMDQFYEPGLPCSLPASIEECLKSDVQLQALEKEVRHISHKNSIALKGAKSRLASHLRKLKQDALRQHQESWIQERRERQVVARGKESSGDLGRTDLVQSLHLLFPERARLAERLTSDQPLTPDAKWLAMDDLFALCTRDFSVIYLPGNRPLNDACPVECCQRALTDIPAVRHHQHIQTCVRREIASKTQHTQSEVQYCYHCFVWVVGVQEWDNHCHKHFETPTSKKCGTITFCHTLVRPAYYPFCLGDTALAAGQRLESWCRDHALWKHIETHLAGPWPQLCPHPSCADVFLLDEQKLYHHFVDEHGISRTWPKRGDSSPGVSMRDFFKESQKRKTCHNNEFLWVSPEPFTSPPSQKRPRICAVDPMTLPKHNQENGDVVSTLSLLPATSLPQTKTLSPFPYGGSFATPSDDEQVRESDFGRLSSDSTCVGSPQSHNDIVSKWIRSPSPEPVPHPMADIGSTESNGMATELCYEAPLNETRIALCDLVAPRDNEIPSDRPAVSIRLHVRPPKPRIKLRVATPQKDSTRSIRGNQKRKCRSRQRCRA